MKVQWFLRLKPLTHQFDIILFPEQENKYILSVWFFLSPFPAIFSSSKEILGFNWSNLCKSCLFRGLILCSVLQMSSFCVSSSSQSVSKEEFICFLRWRYNSSSAYITWYNIFRWLVDIVRLTQLGKLPVSSLSKRINIF